MKVLLFGGNGFLGKALKPVLQENDIECFTVSRTENGADYTMDISNFQDFDKLPSNFFDVVVNCATILPGGNYLDNDYLSSIYKTNILGTQNICKWLSNQNTIQKIINCSTLVVVKKPWDIPLTELNAATYPDGKHVLYTSSKLMQELLFQTFCDERKIALTQIRFAALYGETMQWSGLIPNLINQAQQNNGIKITNGSKVSADFLHVVDAAKIIVASIKSKTTGIVNGASGIETSILELAELIKANCGKKIAIENTEDPNAIFDRASICVKKLNQIIDTKTFISIQEGIKKMMV